MPGMLRRGNPVKPSKRHLNAWNYQLWLRVNLWLNGMFEEILSLGDRHFLQISFGWSDIAPFPEFALILNPA